MKKIAEEIVIGRFGIAIRIIEDGGTFIVQQAPLSQDETYNENDFSIFGVTVGYDSSEFDNEDDAQQFFNDIQILSSEQLAERYPKLWTI